MPRERTAQFVASSAASIRRLQGCFLQAPSALERSHDYLWRVHMACPARGQIGIFNRSHYEDVVTVRVRGLAPEKVWRRRAQHINDFERRLTDEGTTIIKVYLHLSRDEQRERLQERVDNPEKRWKFREGDLDDRALWDDYMATFEETLTETSTDWAPWHVVPTDRNWVRNVAVASLIVETLRDLDPKGSRSGREYRGNGRPRIGLSGSGRYAIGRAATNDGCS